MSAATYAATLNLTLFQSVFTRVAGSALLSLKICGFEESWWASPCVEEGQKKPLPATNATSGGIWLCRSIHSGSAYTPIRATFCCPPFFCAIQLD